MSKHVRQANDRTSLHKRIPSAVGSKVNKRRSNARSPHVMILSGSTPLQRRKTAAMMATGMDMDLYRVNLTEVVSKYIGETEKNLRQVFERAERSQAILYLDEADALFQKRTDVKNVHDRYANLDVSDLLQRIQRYKGLVIMTTTLEGNLDSSVLHSVHVVVRDGAIKKRPTKTWPAKKK
ncbi:MAG: ATP-binding protein [Nitrospirota bacterium]|nr:ATP-binding protein [Nitrospirota bacterium]